MVGSYDRPACWVVMETQVGWSDLFGNEVQDSICMDCPRGFDARRLWFAITALTTFPVLRKLWSNFSNSKAKGDDPTLQEPASTELTPPEGTSLRGKEQAVVSDEDLENLLHILQVKDKGPAWQQIMNRSTTTMTFQAWRYG